MRSDLADSQSPSSRLLPAANWSQEQQKHSQRQRAYDATRRTSDGQHYGYKPPRRKKEKKSADFLLAECKILTCPMRAFFLSLPRPFLLLHHRVDKRGLHFIALTNAVGSPPSPCQRGNNATRGDIGGIRRANGEKSQQKSMARVMVAVIRDSLNNKEWLWWSFGNFPRTGRKMQQHCDVRSPEAEAKLRQGGRRRAGAPGPSCRAGTGLVPVGFPVGPMRGSCGAHAGSCGLMRAHAGLMRAHAWLMRGSC